MNNNFFLIDFHALRHASLRPYGYCNLGNEKSLALLSNFMIPNLAKILIEFEQLNLHFCLEHLLRLKENFRNDITKCYFFSFFPTILQNFSESFV